MRNRTAGRHVPKANQPDWIVKELAALRQELAELRAARTLESASIGAGGLTVLGGDITLNGGDLVSADFVHGASGFKLDGTTGTPEFNDLILRGGIIGDDALQHPTRLDLNFADVNGTNFTVPGANLASASVPVPAGFTTAQVVCIATIGDSRNAAAGDSPLYGQAWIGKNGGSTTGSAVIAVTVKDGGANSITMGWMRVLTGLSSGDTVEGGAWASVDTTSGWLSGAGNAHTVVSVTFYR